MSMFGKLSQQELTEKAAEMLKHRDPMDPIIAKLADRGYDASSAFEVFDVDMDEVLTKKEIKDGLRNYDIILTEDEMALLMREIDKNSDGVITRDEWETILTPKVTAGMEYLKIMGDIKVDDPLVLQERSLDLMYRNKRIEDELKVLRAQNTNKSQLDVEAAIKKTSKEILHAEKNQRGSKESVQQKEQEIEK